jgi:hypothetical protein
MIPLSDNFSPVSSFTVLYFFSDCFTFATGTDFFTELKPSLNCYNRVYGVIAADFASMIGNEC